MPTDQESARTAGLLAEGQDTADQIHSEPPEPTELRHGTSSDSIPSDWKHSSERLATYAEVDETDDGLDTFRGGGEKNGSKIGQSPGQQDQSGQLDNANMNDHPRHSETSSDRKSRDGVPDNISDVGVKNGTVPTDQQVNTKLNQDTFDKNFKAAQSVVNNLDDESEKHPQNESSSEKDTKHVVQTGVATGQGGQVTKKAEQKAEAKPSEDGSAAKTPRGTSGKPTTAKQGKKDHSRETDQKTGKRTPSAPSKSPRIGDSRVHRPPTERNPKKDDKYDKNEEKQKSTQSRTSGKPGTPVSRPVDSRETKLAESKPPVEKPTQSDAGSATDTTDNPTTATSPGTKPDTEETKPVNGMVPDGGKEKGKEPEVKENNKKEDEKEQQPQHKKAHALLSRAVMRRITTMEKAPSGQTSPSPRGNNAAADLNSSAGAKSLGGGGGGKSPSPVPSHGRSAHKTLSMQSLAVPATGIGPTPVETDDKEESLGSRRDSVRQSVDSNSRKSVDYRLQTSHTVVTPAAAEEKPNSMWHDDSVIRAAIPALPVPLAVFCLIINIVLPGSGELFVSDQNIYGERR